MRRSRIISILLVVVFMVSLIGCEDSRAMEEEISTTIHTEKENVITTEAGGVELLTESATGGENCLYFCDKPLAFEFQGGATPVESNNRYEVTVRYTKWIGNNNRDYLEEAWEAIGYGRSTPENSYPMSRSDLVYDLVDRYDAMLLMELSVKDLTDKDYSKIVDEGDYESLYVPICLLKDSVEKSGKERDELSFDNRNESDDKKKIITWLFVEDSDGRARFNLLSQINSYLAVNAKMKDKTWGPVRVAIAVCHLDDSVEDSNIDSDFWPNLWINVGGYVIPNRSQTPDGEYVEFQVPVHEGN